MVRTKRESERGCSATLSATSATPRERGRVREAPGSAHMHTGPDNTRTIADKTTGTAFPPSSPRTFHQDAIGSGPRQREDIKGCCARAETRERDNGIATREQDEERREEGRNGKVNEEKERERGASYSAVGPEHDLRSSPARTSATPGAFFLSLSLSSFLLLPCSLSLCANHT